jgi:A/G-specific adenine glycosylase
MDNRYFSDKVVKWYDQNFRDLPWRQTRDPYKIWLSEIILQQTRVNQGLPYYLKFVEAYPDVLALAKAPEQEVLRLWQGLGYYTRARNLHKCAREVATNHQGQFPKSFEALKKLPGIGEYTAAAIASFCFQEPVAVVDGNVFRVLSRLLGIEAPINSPDGKKQFTNQANALINIKRPDVHNQAVMEFGALHCTPKNPDCKRCPFVSTCFAALHNMQNKLPLKLKGKRARKRYFNYIVFKKGDALWMKKRQQKDIWNGLYDFYLVETKRAVKPESVFEADEELKRIKASPQVVIAQKKYKHILTHQIIISTFTVIEQQRLPKNTADYKFYSKKKIAELPKPVLISKFLEDHQLL